jgi:chromosome partitioning protein
MKVLAIVNQKGGVGKTTTAVTVAHGLALRGLRVLLVDLDAQGNCADALGIKKWNGVYAWLALGTPLGPPTRGGKGEGVARTVREGFDLVASDKTTVKAKKIINGESFSERVLRGALDALHGAYDIVVLDSAPGADVLQINALVAASHFIIPVSLAHLATVGARDMLGTVASLKRVGAFQGQFLGILPTMWERTTKEGHAQLRGIAEAFGKMVYPPIPIDVKAREAPGHGKTLWEYAPGCRALRGTPLNPPTRGGRRVGGYEKVVTRVVDEVGL